MKTTYQKTHHPVSRTEVKCDGAVVNGVCEKCGRWLKRKGLHNPNQDGSLGYVERYADGSVFVTDPRERF